MQEGLTLDRPAAARAPTWPAVMGKREYGQYRRARFGRGSAPAVTKWIKGGKITAPALRGDGRIDRVLADAQLKARLDATRLGDAEDPEYAEDPEDRALDTARAATPWDGKSVGSVAQEQAALANVRRRKIEIETLELEGRLVNKKDVEAAAFEMARMLRDRVLAVPPKIAGTIAGMTEEREVLAAMRRALADALAAMTNELQSDSEPNADAA